MLMYYAENERHVGPLDDLSFERLVGNGTITSDTMVWTERMTDWLPYTEAKKAGYFDPQAAPPLDPNQVATCLFSGKEFPVAEMFPYGNGYVANQHRDAFYAQMAHSDTSAATDLPYAGFWIRALAFLVDGLILYAINYVVQSLVVSDLPTIQNMEELAAAIVPLMLVSLLNMAISVAYIAWFLGRFGATPGKMAFGLVVVSATGEKISYARAAGRACAELLSSLLFYIGYLLAAFDTPQRRTLHDRLCDTRVIHRRTAP